MGIAEDLKTLEDLHQKGKLTDKEFSDAKAAALQKVGQPPSSPAPKRFMHPVTKALLVVLLLYLGLLWYNNGTRKTSQMLATAVHAPVTVTEAVENIPANSWKAIAFSVPYRGTVEINLRVVRGNPIDVLVTPSDQIELMKKGQWNNVYTYGDFSAMKTQTYRRTGQLIPGSFYLVLRDTSLGILSQAASDVSVKVQLNP
jgi:hypothetical protein